MSDEPLFKCPFCGEGDFDLIGLKMHLVRGWCEPFDRTVIGTTSIENMTPAASAAGGEREER